VRSNAVKVRFQASGGRRITGQLHRQARDMPPGSRITGFTVAPPPSQG
jgi:hypothetical protein